MAITPPLYRYERKYISEVLSSADLHQHVLSHPSLFHSTYAPRQVWSMYFDTPEQDYYLQNLLGQSHRIKVRLRWYVDYNGLQPLQLEIKQREGEVMAKHTFPLNLTLD